MMGREGGGAGGEWGREGGGGEGGGKGAGGEGGGVKLTLPPSPRKTILKKSGLIRVKGKQLNGSKNWFCVVYQTRKFSARKTKIVNCSGRTLIQLKIITRQAV